MSWLRLCGPGHEALFSLANVDTTGHFYIDDDVFELKSRLECLRSHYESRFSVSLDLVCNIVTLALIFWAGVVWRFFDIFVRLILVILWMEDSQRPKALEHGGGLGLLWNGMRRSIAG
ncbi:hypothetical protein Nepgr_026031 [Nepenthes gracilis]|uniref:Uncharacterized protein n=1 Tax=Nepenthes gracilis TaxID=150966 RepID=A0AAD3T7B6_NEPGR|nr:hypothetical protein Nepgr_026031 [Nepenthes gracilis]